MIMMMGGAAMVVDPNGVVQWTAHCNDVELS